MQREQAFFPLPRVIRQRNPCRPRRWNKVRFAIPSAHSLDTRQVRNTVVVAYRVLVKYLRCIPTQGQKAGKKNAREREAAEREWKKYCTIQDNFPSQTIALKRCLFFSILATMPQREIITACDDVRKIWNELRLRWKVKIVMKHLEKTCSNFVKF
jgi:hypothetical protein